METLLTPQLLGSLLDQGYTYAMAKIEIFTEDELEVISLTPLKEKPGVEDIPEEFHTFYKLTHEPLQLLNAGPHIRLIVQLNSSITSLVNNEANYDDRYFRYSEEFFQQVLDSIKDYAVFTTNRKGAINSWNAGAENLFQYQKHEILGEDCSILFTPEDASGNLNQQLLQTALKEGKAPNENFHRTKNGELFWASGLLFPLFDERKRHKGFTKIIHNLEEKKQTENRAIEAKSLANNIIATAKEPLVILNENLKIKIASRSFYELFEIDEHQSFDQDIYSLLPGLDMKQLRKLLNDILPNNFTSKNYELNYNSPAGKLRILSIHANRAKSEPDNACVDILSVEDITEDKNIQQEKDDFISIATHELKAPITIIKASTQLLLRYNIDETSPFVKKYLRKIEDQSEKLIQLAAHLLDVSSIRTGKLALKKDEFNICELAVSIVDDFKLLHRDYQIDLEELNACKVKADKLRITQVITNLLANAIKYSPGADKVVVKVFTDDAHKMVTVSVKDFGIGIPEDEQAKIFKRFSRTKLVDDKNISGTGLGLYISAEIIRKHKGKMWFESEKDKGTCFYFAIPIC